jgi:hypothetical protein
MIDIAVAHHRTQKLAKTSDFGAFNINNGIGFLIRYWEHCIFDIIHSEKVSNVRLMQIRIIYPTMLLLSIKGPDG